MIIKLKHGVFMIQRRQTLSFLNLTLVKPKQSGSALILGGYHN